MELPLALFHGYFWNVVEPLLVFFMSLRLLLSVCFDFVKMGLSWLDGFIKRLVFFIWIEIKFSLFFTVFLFFILFFLSGFC